MEVNASPGAVRFVQKRGGRLYAWWDLGGRLSTERPTGEDAGCAFADHDADGFLLCRDEKSFPGFEGLEVLETWEIGIRRWPYRHLRGTVTKKSPEFGRDLSWDLTSRSTRWLSPAFSLGRWSVMLLSWLFVGLWRVVEGLAYALAFALDMTVYLVGRLRGRKVKPTARQRVRDAFYIDFSAPL